MEPAATTETRAVGDFDRIVLQAHGRLELEQGERAGLEIVGAPELLERVLTEQDGTTLHIRTVGDWLDRAKHAAQAGLTAKKITYRATVRELAGLRLTDAARVFCPRLVTPRLELTVSGAGDVTFRWLEAELLDVRLPGACNLNLSGRVTEQAIFMEGIASYSAPRLESRRVRIDLRGAGRAVVCAHEDLDVEIRGLGSVGYYGSPAVRRKVTGLGSVKSLEGR